MSRFGLRDYVPSGRAGRSLAVVAFIDSVGTGMFLAGATVFSIVYLGIPAAEYGWVMAAAGLAGLLLGVPLGRLGDRVGARSLLVALQLWRAAWFCGFAFVSDVWTFAVVMCALAVAEVPVAPLTQAVVGAAVGDDGRVRTMAILRTLRNTGFSIGALAAAPLIASESTWGFRSLVLVNAVSFLVAALLLLRLDLGDTRPEPRTGPSALKALAGLRDVPYLRLTAINSVLVLHMTILSIGIPLWIVTSTSAPASLVAVLTAFNAVMAILLQVPLSRPAENRTGATRSLVWGGLFLAVCCLCLAGAGYVGTWPAVALLVLATAAMTLGEIVQSAGAWELSYSFATEERRVEYLAVFNL